MLSPRKWLNRFLIPVRRGPSEIEGTGCFTVRSFRAGEEIGPVGLGPAQAQDRHSLQVGTQHRGVKEPWRYMNHSCVPSARLRFSSDSVSLIAQRDLARDAELTIDYSQLPEKVSTTFTCHCPKCRNASTRAGFGALASSEQPR